MRNIVGQYEHNYFGAGATAHLAVHSVLVSYHITKGEYSNHIENFFKDLVWCIK